MGFPWEESPGIHTVRAALITNERLRIGPNELATYIREHDLEEERPPLPVVWDRSQAVFVVKQKEDLLYAMGRHHVGLGLVTVLVEGPPWTGVSWIQEKETIEEEDIGEVGEEEAGENADF